MQHLFDEPPLSEEHVQTILALEPRCPECNEVPKYIHIYTQAIHEIWTEVDGSPSERMTDADRLLIQVHSDPYDSELNHPQDNDYPSLECENDHQWTETRLVFKDWGLRFRASR